jgi:uncharacterized delta-60 repeat protein
MFKNLRRSVLALAVVAGSTVAVPVAPQASATGVVAPSAVTSSPSIGAQSVPTWTNTNIIAIAAGGQHTCAIQGSSPSATTGSVFCWGKARSIGDGTDNEANVPVLVSSNEGFTNTAVTKVAAGGDTTCAIEGGSLWCWGGSGGFAGNLGNGTLNSSSLPIKVLANGSGADAFSNNGNVTDVAASFGRTCAIESGKVFCWGYENDALGLGGQSATTSAAYANRVADSATPGFRAATATSLHMGVNFHCAMAGGQLWCWGYGSAGELGDGGTSGSNRPKLVGNSTPGTEFTNASLSSAFTGDNHGCAIVSGKLSCWGRGTDGRLGSGASSNQLIPAAVAQGGGFTNASAVTGGAAGDKHSCAIEAGILYCWGLNGSEGRLGNGGSSNSNIPVKVSPSEVAGFTNTGVGTGVVTAVTASGSGGNSGHVCAIENKVAYCWGSAFGGRLGVGQVFGPGVNKPTKVFVVSAPAAATIDMISPSNGSLNVSIEQPADGGSIITGYDYTVDNGNTFANVPRPSGSNGFYFSITIPNLTNGTQYSVKVRAVNAIGAGAWSAASTGTPSAGGGGGGIGGGGGGGGGCSGGASIMPSSRTEMGTVGQPMSIAAPTPSGYSTAPTFTLANNSYFPPGLNLSSNGSISGTPTSSASGMTSAITVSNGSQSCTYLITFDITGNSTPCVAGAPSSTNSAVTFDSSFSSDGVYQFTSPSGSPAVVDVKAGPNGTLVVAAAEGVFFGGGSPTNSSTIIYRVLPDGSLDTTWGNAGAASIDVNAGTNYGENVENIIVLSDGSVLAAVQVYIAGSNPQQEVRLAKLTSAGVLDTGFATNGFATIHSGTNSNSVYPRDMVAGPSGSVFLLGYVSGGMPSMNVYKVQANGSLDSSFATNGILNIASSGASITADGSGNLYVGGRTSSNPANASLVRYTTTGVVDTTFGTNGQVVFDISQSNSETLNAVTVDNGKITGIVRSSGAMSMMPTYSESAVRVDTDGDIDASFGTAGIATLGTGSVSTEEILVLADGSALLSGYSFGMTPDLAVSAIGSDGSSVGTLVTSPAKISSGTCSISVGSIAVLPSGVYVAGSNYPTGGGSGSPTGFMFKIALNGVSSGGGSGGGSNTPSALPVPTLVTSANAAALVRAPGSESIIVNGQEVVIESNNVNIPAARTPAAQRTAAQVASIQQAGAALLQQFLASLPAGATSTVTVVNTATGAVMQNLVFDANGNSVNVPVEDIVFLDGPQLSLMIGSNNANITADGKYQVGAGGIVGVTGSGLGVSATGEIIAMSTPTLLANFQTTAAGDFTKSATLPSSIGVGDHTLVVASGSTYAMMGIRVVPAALPTTGATTDRVVIIALFTLVFGALFFRGRRTFAL